MDAKAPLLLLCHSGGWDRLYQALSAALAATGTGREVTLVLYFQALERILDEDVDAVRLSPRDPEAEDRLQEAVDRLGTPDLSEMLRRVRAGGRCRVLACSASVALTGRAEAASVVDAVVGWPTVLQLLDGCGQALYL
jgi:peroxiredoxin family protein